MPSPTRASQDLRGAGAYLLAYFRPETDEGGEQIRFAVSGVDDPTSWQELNGGRAVLSNELGEGGARDPFLVRDPRTGRFVIIATDLRIFPEQDWDRATRTGSRSIVVWESENLVEWSPPALVEVSPPEVGNTWAPKAFWSEPRNCWLVIWASSVFPAEEDRAAGRHQRLLAAPTDDFRSFGPTETYHDPGWTVIDASFVEHGGAWFRFSASALSTTRSADRGQHILMERGNALEDPDFRTVVEDIGWPELRHAEGPAVFGDPDGGRWYLLIDENGYRGYQLYSTDDLSSGRWRREESARLPDDARHGSVLPITVEERDRLLAALGEPASGDPV